MNDLSATDRCVKCGLCLPYCPTFTISENEADSPRGRISLMQALDRPEPLHSPGLFEHLDRCLQCRACEAMCPSGVPFGELMDNARAAIEPYRTRSPAGRLLRNTALRLIASRSATTALGQVLKTCQKIGLQRLADRLPGLPAELKRLNRLLPEIGDAGAPAAAPADRQQATVNLFQGCVGNLFDRQTLAASKSLLQKLGYAVRVPHKQTCCGALHQHSGALDTAARLADANLNAFGADNTPILVTASGCAAQLSEYPTLHKQDRYADFAKRVTDILHFLLTLDLQSRRFEPLQAKLAVQFPCTHRNVLGQHRDILEILKVIPGVETVSVNPDGGCCGAAGSYMLSQPQIAERLREPLLGKVIRSEADYLLTSNLGCSLHLQAGLRQLGSPIEVLHPVVLLDRQLRV
jgi:glycolate oxidase iron-sulfur subunit